MGREHSARCELRRELVRSRRADAVRAVDVRAYAVSVNGDLPNIYNPEDALFAAAKYLCANEAATNWQSAVFQYCGGDDGRPGAAAECNGYVSKVASEMAGLDASEPDLGDPSNRRSRHVHRNGDGPDRPSIYMGRRDRRSWVRLFRSRRLLTRQGGHRPQRRLPRLEREPRRDRADALQRHSAEHRRRRPNPGTSSSSAAVRRSVEHVGIYIGNNEMVDAPETGQDVQTQTYAWPDLVAVTSLGSTASSPS